MIYVIDKATNRVIYQVPEEGKYFIDENSYELIADAVEFVQDAYKYRWNPVTKVFDYSPEKKLASIYPMPTAAPAPKEPVEGKMILTPGIIDEAYFNSEIYKDKLKFDEQSLGSIPT